MQLNNFQLVLLDNLIYVLKAEEGDYKNKSLEGIILDLLYKDGIKTDKINSKDEEERKKHLGKIGEFYNNDNTGKPQCGMELEEWIHVLQAIEKDENLCSLKIHDVTSEESSGFRAATFTSDTENIIIFKGTTEVEEWLDNGVGGYSVETPAQERALDYVNNLNLVNNNPFTVSGHSKGGNLAQYVTLFASYPVIDKCLSLDGQGFSNELCETNDYKDALKRNQDKMYMVSSSGDYVNVLFNSAILDKNKMYVKANPVGISLVS